MAQEPIAMTPAATSTTAGLRGALVSQHVAAYEALERLLEHGLTVRRGERPSSGPDGQQYERGLDIHGLSAELDVCRSRLAFWRHQHPTETLSRTTQLGEA